MTTSTVPRPPATDDLWAVDPDVVDALVDHGKEPIDVRAMVVSVLVAVLVAVPAFLALATGFVIRCGALIVGAVVEAYKVGRGTRG